MKSQKEGGFGPPRAGTPWKKKKKNYTLVICMPTGMPCIERNIF
jgi:hypothetical protein